MCCSPRRHLLDYPESFVRIQLAIVYFTRHFISFTQTISICGQFQVLSGGISHVRIFLHLLLLDGLELHVCVRRVFTMVIKPNHLLTAT